MKRTICLILFLIFALSSTLCTAEGFDLSRLSLAELESLATRVSARIHEVQVENGTVYSQGFYTVGVDFPAGFSRVSVTSKSQTGLSTFIAIDGTAQGSVNYIVAVSDLFDDYFLFLFKNGQSVTIMGDDVIVAPYI